MSTVAERYAATCSVMSVEELLEVLGGYIAGDWINLPELYADRDPDVLITELAKRALELLPGLKKTPEGKPYFTLDLEPHEDALAGLLQSTYGKSSEEAEEIIKNGFEYMVLNSQWY